MNIFAIGDLHLYFSVGEEKSMDMFGSAWVNHFDRLAENWRRIVAPEDLVILPGDFSWAMKTEEAAEDFRMLCGLPGRKLLLKGNHDLWWGSLKKMKALYPDVDFLYNDAYIGQGFAIAGSRGWLCPEDKDFREDTDRRVYERELLRLEMSLKPAREARDAAMARGERFVIIGAMHFPPSAFPDGRSAFCEAFKASGVKTVVYGHLHGESAYKNGPEGDIDGVSYHLCSVDRLNCCPLLVASCPRDL